LISSARQIASTSGHRVPVRQLSQEFRAPMLPGFRFLFAAIMLSMSLLVFGLGAAALLRAAHESFASNSSWRGAPEVTFTPRDDATLSVLATLSVEPATEKANDAAKAVAAPAEPISPAAETTSSSQVAAPALSEAPAIDAAKPDVAPAQTGLSDNPPAPAAAPAAEAATPDETKMAAVTTSEASPDNSPSAMPQSEPAVSQPTPTVVVPAAAAPATTAEPNVAVTNIAATKIATLGGPPVDIAVKDKTARPGRASGDPNAIQKRVHARRVVRRRRLSARALLAAQQLQQQQANPFGQPQTYTPTAPH
jgi:hypothetical protein